MAQRDDYQPSSRRGFAAMSEKERRAIASKGGRAAHERGTAHQWNSAEAAEAGRRGGRAQRFQSRRSYSDEEKGEDRQLTRSDSDGSEKQEGSVRGAVRTPSKGEEKDAEGSPQSGNRRGFFGDGS